MSKTVSQIYAINPSLTIAATDLLYLVQSPYTPGTDSAILGSALIAQFATPGAALTRINDTNVTLTLGGSPTTALVNAASLTLGWTGQLGLTRGGSGANLVASNGGIVYSNATTLAILAGTATAGQMLRSGASVAPTWSTATYPAAATNAARILRADGTNWVETTATFADIYSASSILYANGANNVAGLTTANNGLLVTGNTGIPSLLGGPGTSRNLLMSNAAAAPSFTTETYAVPGAVGNVMTSDGTNWLSSAPAGGITEAQIQNQAFTFGVSFGSGNALAITLSPAPAAYAEGQLFIVRSNANNTASTTIDINSLGTKTLYVDDAGAGPNTLTGGEIQGGHTYLLEYSGAISAFYLLNPSIYKSLIIKGTTTNNNATAGFIGEYAESIILIGSAVSLVTATSKTITSISLTAGDWDVWGEFAPTGAGTTVLQSINGAVSLTDNTLPTAPATNGSSEKSGTVSYTLGTSNIPYYNLVPCRISIAGTTTVYLVMNVTFITSTAAGYGKICARRVR